MRNIPIPTNKEYTKRLIEKTEDVLLRMRWKALFFLHPKPNLMIKKPTDSTPQKRHR